MPNNVNTIPLEKSFRMPSTEPNAHKEHEERLQRIKIARGNFRNKQIVLLEEMLSNPSLEPAAHKLIEQKLTETKIQKFKAEYSELTTRELTLLARQIAEEAAKDSQLKIEAINELTQEKIAAEIKEEKSRRPAKIDADLQSARAAMQNGGFTRIQKIKPTEIKQIEPSKAEDEVIKNPKVNVLDSIQFARNQRRADELIQKKKDANAAIETREYSIKVIAEKLSSLYTKLDEFEFKLLSELVNSSGIGKSGGLMPIMQIIRQNGKLDTKQQLEKFVGVKGLTDYLD